MLIVKKRKIICFAVFLIASVLLLRFINSSAVSAAALPKSNPVLSPTTTVPILMYHYIRAFDNRLDPVGIGLSVPPEKFLSQMQDLQRLGYQSVGLDFFRFPWNMNRPVIITFDDGYDDAYTNAFPILKDMGFKGVFFVIMEKIGTPGYLSWKQIKEMHDAGMEIAPHTATHPDLTLVGDNNMHWQLELGKRLLEGVLGRTVVDFAYPFGKYDQHVIDKLKGLGFLTAVTTVGGVNYQNTDLFQLKRIRMSRWSLVEKELKKWKGKTIPVTSTIKKDAK